MDLARAKSEALANNAYKRKKLNRVMLNGRAIKMESRSIDLISKKNKFARAARFLSFFAVVLHNYNAVL